MNQTIKNVVYVVLGVIAFLLVWAVSHIQVGIAMVGAPAFGIIVGWLYERAFPHAYDSTLKDHPHA